MLPQAIAEQRRTETRDCWDDLRRAVNEKLEAAIAQACSVDGKLMHVSIEFPVHGYRPGQVILGVKTK